MALPAAMLAQDQPEGAKPKQQETRRRGHGDAVGTARSMAAGAIAARPNAAG